jgi:osmotically-inducible protein OsmY
MSYPSNRGQRDREQAYFQDDPEEQRGFEGHSRSSMSEREYEQRRLRSGRDEGGDRPRQGSYRDRFGEGSYRDPYSGRSFGSEESYRGASPRQRGYAPYPFGEEDFRRNLEDWQQPYQMETGNPYGRGYAGEASREPYQSHPYGTFRGHGSPSGQFRGKGPKGYQRSDERLHEDICERLTDDVSIDASEITVEVRSGEVTLSGTVPDRRMKRAAEDLVEETSGVKQVHNTLRVEWQPEDRESGDTYGTQGGRQAIRH